MTIRLEKTNGTTYANSRGVRLVIQSTVAVDTEAEALEAKRAFENVLAPRFTRDEAIAIVKKAIVAHHAQGPDGWPEIAATARVVLEALATAGVFSDCGPEQCFSSESCARSMADKLDAAGIR
jgi:hypothetical protein